MRKLKRELEVVCGIIEKNHRYLIAKRSEGSDLGFYEFPGGKVEKNETFQQALIRELKEELNLDVTIKKHILDFDDEREDKIIHLHAYLCHIQSGNLSLSAHSEIQWIQLHEVFNYPFQEADQVLLNYLQQFEVY